MSTKQASSFNIAQPWSWLSCCALTLWLNCIFRRCASSWSGLGFRLALTPLVFSIKFLRAPVSSLWLLVDGTWMAYLICAGVLGDHAGSLTTSWTRCCRAVCPQCLWGIAAPVLFYLSEALSIHAWNQRFFSCHAWTHESSLCTWHVTLRVCSRRNTIVCLPSLSSPGNANICRCPSRFHCGFPLQLVLCCVYSARVVRLIKIYPNLQGFIFNTHIFFFILVSFMSPPIHPYQIPVCWALSYLLKGRKWSRGTDLWQFSSKDRRRKFKQSPMKSQAWKTGEWRERKIKEPGRTLLHHIQ